MVRELRQPVAGLVEVVFAARRAWYRTRYRRLELGAGVRIVGRLKLSGGTRLVLGDRVRVRQVVRVNGGGTVVVGADSLLNGCWILASDTVELGDHCLVSDCGITDNDFHNLDPAQRHDPPLPQTRRPVVIGRNVWLGARSLVLKGVRIGDHSVVAAGAVVRAEVPPAVVVSGNPAVVVKHLRDPDAAG